jgi:uncharacterized protein
MQRPPRGGDGERDPWQIDWSNIDFSTFGRRRQRPGGPPAGVAIFGALLAIVFVVLPLIFGPLVAFLTDLLWFRSLGFEDVYTLRYRAGFWAFVTFFLAFFVFSAVNLYFALRPRARRVVVDEGSRPSGALGLTLRLLPLLLIPSFFFGLVGGGEWDVILRWLNGVPFGQTDPLFGRDIGFYFFTLPFVEFVRGWLLAAVVLTAIGVIVVYATRSAAGIATMTTVEAPRSMGDVGRMALPFVGAARVHLSVLAALFLALVSAGYFLDQFGLLFRQEAVLTGAGYTSVNARLPALTILSVLVGAAALLALANAFVRTLWLLGGALGLSLVASVLLLGVYPGLVQTFLVNPDPVNRERPYLERHIQGTRAAYGLDEIEESSFDPDVDPGTDELQAFGADLTSVRLWDWRRLLDVYQQIQGLRQYYAFSDVDVDRYAIDGDEAPVMLAARELDVTRLPREARTWQNQHLVYTHGFGAVVTEVGAVTPEGLPRMSLRDIPPQGQPAVEEPRIYYGELTGNYVIVGTTQDEFDFARGEGLDAAYRFAGTGGVGVGGLWDRLLFAVRFGDGNMLVTPQLTSESRVLFHRDIAERARLVAPFLAFDGDPYLVVADGKLWWMHDAYTTGSGYPYSKYTQGANYFRNSVKLVTNAFDGSMTFYVVDEQDPVIGTLRGIYPTLFAKSIEEMPASLRSHVRYPEDLFRIQVDVFQTFHMNDPQEFYNRGDQWRLATEIVEQGGPPQAIEPYYITTMLPGSDRREFILFVPMTPAASDRDNMVAWIAGRADPPDYGRLRVLRFPKDRLIFGPLQIEARIEADSAIRQQLTLLSAGAGANVLRGNLLVIPVGDSFIYVEPLFVQASQGRIPELKRVILATQDRIVMEDSFEEALATLHSQIAAGVPPTIPAPGASPTPTPAPTATAGATPQPTPGTGVPTVAQLVREASDHFEAAQAAYARGDFAEYGRRLELLQRSLANLRALTGQ